jgi:hypothetical protein
MKQVGKLLEEYGALMGRADSESEKRLQEIREELKALDGPKMQKELDRFLEKRLVAIEKDVEFLQTKFQ